jgi:hypothetical protein
MRSASGPWFVRQKLRSAKKTGHASNSKWLLTRKASFSIVKLEYRLAYHPMPPLNGLQMMDLFALKIIISFFLGGMFIAAQSVLAERWPNMGGLIISVPSTLPIDLFFIGWSEGIGPALEAASIVPIAIALILLFSTVYIYSAQYVRQRIPSLLVANISSLCVWVILAVLAVTFRFDNIGWELGIFTAVLLVTGYLLSFKQKGPSSSVPCRTTSLTGRKVALRALFAGSIIASSVALSKALNPLWGGVLSVFPASYLSTFNMIHKSAGQEHLITIGKTIPEGSVFFLVYVVLVRYLFTLGIFWGTLLAELITICLIVILSKLKQMYRTRTFSGGLR